VGEVDELRPVRLYANVTRLVETGGAEDNDEVHLTLSGLLLSVHKLSLTSRRDRAL
jgi:hypothetical protein